MSSVSIPARAQDAAALWGQYAVDRDLRTREALIEQYAPLVKYVVDRLRLALSATLDRDDLLGYGAIGLIEAVDRFDPRRGVKFETYAIPRIRGAIIDAVRALDIVPRSARQRARAIEHAYRELFERDGRMPADEAVAAHLGMDTHEFRQALDEVACAVVPLQQPGHDGEITLEDMLPDPHAAAPLDVAARADLIRQVAHAIEELPERERLIVILYYYEELTLKEISQVLGVTESRVSQILTRVRIQLRVLLGERGVTALDLAS